MVLCPPGGSGGLVAVNPGPWARGRSTRSTPRRRATRSRCCLGPDCAQLVTVSPGPSARGQPSPRRLLGAADPGAVPRGSGKASVLRCRFGWTNPGAMPRVNGKLTYGVMPAWRFWWVGCGEPRAMGPGSVHPHDSPVSGHAESVLRAARRCRVGYGEPRAVGPGLTHPHWWTVSERAAVKEAMRAQRSVEWVCMASSPSHVLLAQAGLGGLTPGRCPGVQGRRAE